VITLAQDLGYQVREQDLPREMLYVADELFFTGTAAEVSPIKSVDKVPIGSGRRGPITAALQQAFFDYVNGVVPDRHNWLLPVEIPQSRAVSGPAGPGVPRRGPARLRSCLSVAVSSPAPSASDAADLLNNSARTTWALPIRQHSCSSRKASSRTWLN
jgi:hypothetical protein